MKAPITMLLLILVVGCGSLSCDDTFLPASPTPLGTGLQSSDLLGTGEYHRLPTRYHSDIGIGGYRHEELEHLHDLLYRFRRTSWSSLYEKGVFDCSNMSAFLHDYLEGQGFTVYILVAEITERDWAYALQVEIEKLFALSEGGKQYHAWLAVEIDEGEYVAIESTIPTETWYYGAYKYQAIRMDRPDWGEYRYEGLAQVAIINAQLD